MLAIRHRPNDTGEDDELLVLRTQERLRFEEGDHLLEKVIPLSDNEHQRGVRRASVVLTNPSAAQSLSDQVEDLTALRRLADVELGHELETNSGARIPLDGYVERSFSVHEACNVGIQSFLLIVRTWRIVTVHASTLRRGCDNDS